MTRSDLVTIRLASQQLLTPKFDSAKALVSHFGAIQAQDYPMSKWAIGCRLPGSTDESIENALDKGEIIRTHVLRPTWHLAASEDIAWMLELTGQTILRQIKSMNAKLGLDAKTFSKSTALISKSLEGGNHLTREELVAILNKEGIQTNEYRSGHILAHNELNQVICSGKRKEKQHTYALFNERIKKSKSLSKDEALASLAKAYFRSHGPATLKDFVWWSGLSVGDAKVAIEFNRKTLTEKECDGQHYFWNDSAGHSMTEHAMLLPSFDEILIAYKNRSASIDPDHMGQAFTKNGIFKPLIVVNGQVVGIWKRTVKKASVIIEPNYFQKVSKSIEKKVVDAAEDYGRFLGATVQILTK